jgi:hypothetical protein
MKKGPDALDTVENTSGSGILENGTGHPRYHRNEPGAQNMKTEPDALGTAKNESGRAIHENET